MKSPTLKSDALLLLTATIWGFAFVAQRVGMDFVGPFAFNGIRFALGSLVLVPIYFETGPKTRRPGRSWRRQRTVNDLCGAADWPV